MSPGFDARDLDANGATAAFRPAVLALWICLGCVSPGVPTTRVCVEPECEACLEATAGPGTAEVARRSTELEALATELEASLAERCDAMIAQLNLRDTPSGLSACPVVAVEVARRVRELLPQGVRLSIAKEPALCHTSFEAATGCAERCGAPTAELVCEGDLLAACDGHCEGTCHGLCGDTCEGACSDFCDGDCDAVCIGICEGECATLDRDRRCLVSCDGRCALGACNGTCTGTCSGVCTEACAGACTGTCVGTCEGAWEPACLGVVLVRSAPCGLACTAAAAIAADCPVPEVRVRGPEAEDPRDHGLIDQLVLTTSRHYEHLYAIEARVRVTLAPWMDALGAVMDLAADVHPQSCLWERARLARDAIGRLRAARALTVTLIAAAEDSVGEKLD